MTGRAPLVLDGADEGVEKGGTHSEEGKAAVQAHVVEFVVHDFGKRRFDPGEKCISPPLLYNIPQAIWLYFSGRAAHHHLSCIVDGILTYHATAHQFVFDPLPAQRDLLAVGQGLRQGREHKIPPAFASVGMHHRHVDHTAPLCLLLWRIVGKHTGPDKRIHGEGGVRESPCVARCDRAQQLMPKRSDPETLLRKHWTKALSIACILFEEDGYHTRYLEEIEAFIRRQPMPIPDKPHALDEDTTTRVNSLAERMGRVAGWSDDPHDPGRGTDADLGQVVEEVRALVANDPQAAKALWATYAPKNGRRLEALDTHSADMSGEALAKAEPPCSEAHRYRLDHYPYSRFWAVYAGEELVAVTVYRKGAQAITDRLEAQERTIAALRQQLAARTQAAAVKGPSHEMA